MIEQASIENLKAGIDIIDVIGSYIELKKAGSNYKANCPFHAENTPSFVASPSKQIFHCFGCGAGGDAIKFVMEYEKLSYPEAIEKLAAMYNFTLRYTKSSDGGYIEEKRILEAIQRFYKMELERYPQAVTYLKNRGVTQDSIERFGVGYAPSSSAVLRYLQSQAIPQPKALQAGVLNQTDGGRIYARLSERITFPIYNSAGALVGFGGRTLGNHPAKYINSPTTKLFNKSRLFYGYHLAKQNIFAKKRIIITEGYLDVIMLHQVGFNEAVATLGTSLTKEHLPLLSKTEAYVVLAYDGDEAGKEAAIKAAMLLASAQIQGGVVLFGKGADPADMIHQGRSDEVAALLRKPTDIIVFVLEQIALRYDKNDPYQKKSAFEEARRFLQTLDPIVKESYIPLASSLLGVAQSHFEEDQKKRQGAPRAIQKDSEDVALLGVLKTLIENPSCIEEVKAAVHPSLFGRYSALYEAIIAKREDEPLIRRLMLDDRIATFSKEELLETLRGISLKAYEGAIMRIGKDSAIAFEQKSYLIRKLKNEIIPKLKRGEMVGFVPLESL